VLLQEVGAGLEHLAAANLKSVRLEPLDHFADETTGHAIGLQQNEGGIHARGILSGARAAKSRICVAA
jgi:hypothetical protein